MMVSRSSGGCCDRQQQALYTCRGSLLKCALMLMRVRVLTLRQPIEPVQLQEQASALHAMGMLDYGALKSRLTIATAALVAIGTATFAVTGDHLHVSLCMQPCARASACLLPCTAAVLLLNTLVRQMH